jgi:hypothetical protein
MDQKVLVLVLVAVLLVALLVALPRSTPPTTTVSATSGSAPTPTTGSATGVTSNWATLNGTVNPNGLSTTVYFEWGTSTSYGTKTPSQSDVSGTTNVPLSANLTALLPNTTFHYRLVAINSAGTRNGFDVTFKTTSSGSSATTGVPAASGPTSRSSATTSTTAEPRDINASVSFTGTQFVITNLEDRDWTNVRLEIDPGFFSSGYTLKVQRMEAGVTYTVGAMQFANANGERFNPFSHKPRRFDILEFSSPWPEQADLEGIAIFSVD